MARLSYEYFCGANVVVEIEGMPILEAAGLSCNISESKRPIYGYSSRHFDAVARGQVIVQGSLVVNYVHQDYLFRAIELGLQERGLLSSTELSTLPVLDSASKEFLDLMEDAKQRDAMATEMLSNYPESVRLAQAFKERYWNPPISQGGLQPLFPNPHDSFGGLDIQITFGERSVSNQNKGVTGLLIADAYITGRGLPIRIDEETIVEEYPFFARNIYSVSPKYFEVQSLTEPGTDIILDSPFTTILPVG